MQDKKNLPDQQIPSKEDFISTANRIASVALKALVIAITAAAAFKFLPQTPPSSQQQEARPTLNIVMPHDQDYGYYPQEHYQQKMHNNASRNIQKLRVDELIDELNQSKLLIDQLKAKVLVVEENGEQKHKTRIRNLEAVIEESGRKLAAMETELRSKEALIDSRWREFEAVTRTFGESSESLKSQLERSLILLTEEKESNQDLFDKLQSLQAHNIENEKFQDELTTKLAELQERNQSLLNEMAMSESLIARLQDSNFQLEESFGELEFLNVDLARQLQQAQLANNKLQEKLTSPNLEQIELAQQIEQIEEVNLIFSRQLHDFQHRIENLNSANINLEERLAASSTTNLELENQLTEANLDYEKKLAASEAANLKLEDQLAALAEVNSLHEKKLAASAAANLKLEDKLAALAAATLQNEQQLTTSATTANLELKEKLAASTAANQKLEDQLAALAEVNSLHEKKLAASAAANLKLEDKLAALAAANLQNEQQLTTSATMANLELKQKLEAATAANQKLEDRLAAVAAANLQREQQLTTSANMANFRHEKQLKASVFANLHLEDQLAALARVNLSHEKQLAAAKASNLHLEEQLAASTSTRSRLDEQLTAVHDTLYRNESELKRLKSANIELATAKEALELGGASAASQEKKRLEELKLANRNLSAENSSLEKQLAVFRIEKEQLAKLEQTNDTLANANKELQLKLAALLEAKQSYRERLENENLIAVASSQELQQENRRLQQYSHDYAKQTANLEKRLHELDHTCARQKQMIDDLTVQLAVSDARTLSYNEELKELRYNSENSELVAALQEQLQTLQDALAGAENHLVALSEENAFFDSKKGTVQFELEQALDHLESENQRLLAESNTMKRRLNSLDGVETKISTLQAKLQDEQDQVAYLQGELAKRSGVPLSPENDFAYHELEEELKTTLDLYQTEKRRSVKLQEELLGSQKLLSTLQNDLGFSSDSSKDGFYMKDANPNKLKSKIAQLTTRLANEMSKTQETEDRLGALEIKFRQLAKHTDEVKKQLYHATRNDGNMTNYHGANEIVDPKLKELSEQLNMVKGELSQTKERAARLERRLQLEKNSSSKDFVQLPEGEDQAALHEELRQYKLTLLSLQNEFNELSCEHSELESSNAVLASKYNKTVSEYQDLLAEEKNKAELVLSDLQTLHSLYEAEMQRADSLQDELSDLGSSR